MNLDNYEKLDNGVIKQINKVNSDFIYDDNYIKTYEDFKERGTYMSYLRLGYLLSNINIKNPSILDIGYGSGDFLRVAKDAGFESFGYDITDYELDGIPTISYDEVFKKHFNIITFFDSLEHFEDIDFVSELDCDYIIISLPECHNFSDEWFFNWKHRKPDEHLFHFNKDSLIRFMDEMGYDMVNISNIEDVIRKPVDKNSNILSGVFKKKTS